MSARVFLGCTALCALAYASGAALSAPEPAPAPRPKKPVLYFPTTVGAKWVYQSRDREWVQVVTDVKEKDGVFIVTYDNLAKDGTPERTWKMSVSDRGLVVVRDEVAKFDPRHLDLKLPHKEGEVWRDDELGLRFKSLAPVKVKVPAGEFDALPVESENARGEIQTRETRWYAPGIGLVKLSEPTVVLKSFMPGKEPAPKDKK